MKVLRIFPLFAILCIALTQTFAQGTLRGTLIDQNTGEPIMFGNVLIPALGSGTTTDLDGTYTMDLEAGTYTIRFSYLGYSDLNVSEVIIKDNEVTLLDGKLNEESELLDEVVVTAAQVRNTEAALATIRRNSINLLDGVSSSSFRKIGDANAAAAVKRVPGVSIEGGKYVFVRGLGDRYTKSILNGMDVPGLDPDRNTLQMDIFPTSILDNIIVLKSFTADLPADFTGGVVNITTKDFPETKTSSISVGIGYNPSMHFNSSYLSYDGSSTDILGFDDGQRAIPTDRSTDVPDRTQVLGPNGDTKAAEYNSIINKFNPILAGKRTTSFMDYNLGYSLGNQFKRNKYTIGYNLALTYKNSTDYYENAIYRRYGKGNTSDILDLDLRESQIGDIGENNVLLGGLGGFSFKTQTSKYNLNLIHLQNGESKTGFFNYIGQDQGANFTADQHNLEYSQRSITNVLLNGVHSLDDGNWDINWKLAPTFSKITDPDIRFTRIRTDGDELSIGTESGVPARIWRYLNEMNLSGKADAERKYAFLGESAKVKFGAGYTYKQRDFEIQNFSIFTGNVEVTEDPNILFTQENFFTKENTSGLYYQPNFIPINANSFDANTSTISGYISNEFEPLKNLKAIVGLRMETFTQKYTGVNQDRVQFDNETVIDDVDFFPTLNLIYGLTEMSNLRGSITKTIARPSFKEASYATIIDPLSGRTFIGGFFPDIDVTTGETIWDGNLQSTDIINADLRYEYFADRGQNISVSTFYKKFSNPIEIVQYVQAANNFQPRNVGDGQVIGVEVEFRKHFGAMNTTLGNLYVSGNITFTESQIEMSETEYTSRVNNARDGESIDDTREMAGQAPYLINGGLGYADGDLGLDVGVFYNVQGQTLQFVGIADRPDVYTVPFHSLNLTANYKFGADKRYRVGIKADNILQSKRESVFKSFGAKDQLFTSLAPQTSFGVSFSYRLF